MIEQVIAMTFRVCCDRCGEPSRAEHSPAVAKQVAVQAGYQCNAWTLDGCARETHFCPSCLIKVEKVLDDKGAVRAFVPAN